MLTLPHSRPLLISGFLGGAALLSGCDSQGPNTACAAPRSIAIQLTVTDSTTGAGIADSAYGLIVSGTYSDSLHHVVPSPTLLIAGDSLGTYSVTVQRPGYADWTRQGVSVSQVGLCGNVLPVALDVPLQPLP
jgi:hypothetical protein